MAEGRTLRIFLPHEMLIMESGILLGRSSSDGSIACITYLEHPSKANKLHKTNLHVLGLWRNTYDDRVSDIMYSTEMTAFLKMSKTNWFQLEKHNAGLPVCKMSRDNHGFTSIMVIIYNAQSLQNSYYLNESACKNSRENGHYQNGTAPTIDTNIEQLTYMLMLSEGTSDSITMRPLTNLDSGYLTPLATFMDTLFYYVLNVFFMLTSVLINNRLVRSGYVEKVVGVPAVCCQLRKRYNHTLQELTKRNKSLQNQLRYKNCLCVLGVDIFFGVLLMLWLLRQNKASVLAEFIMNWADRIVSDLHQLLVWLMGVPAGLKLNSQLDQLLGKFFQYHIYLWTGYLEVIRPILVDVLWFISLMGCLGISVQLCLIQDLISMMTLHIYCFYVYAARLYSLQVYALSSLWRLFRGKKWNVLRQRVDSASYDVDQLFMGTLLFTILLFLLPTTALYYIVFTVLRLLVLSVQGCLHKIVMGINLVPIYSILSKYFHSDCVADNVNFHIIGKDINGTIYLSMQTLPASLTTIIASDKADIALDTSDSWSTFIKKLFAGHLVYPWIEPKYVSTHM